MSLKERLFTFSAGCGEATVTCKHCGWSSKGGTGKQGEAQDVFDRSNDHECPGVESYAAFRERDQRELERWRAGGAVECQGDLNCPATLHIEGCFAVDYNGNPIARTAS